MDSTNLQTVQKTMSKIHIHILSVGAIKNIKNIIIFFYIIVILFILRVIVFDIQLHIL